jgi:hypothetical protein
MSDRSIGHETRDRSRPGQDLWHMAVEAVRASIEVWEVERGELDEDY